MLSIDAANAAAVAGAAALFGAYRTSLIDMGVPIDTFQGFAVEIESLPGPYAEPAGVLLVAVSADDDLTVHDAAAATTDATATLPPRWDGRREPMGCAALKPLAVAADGVRVCEVKRLYVRPEYRGRGVARALSEALLRYAWAAGYDRVVLDTLRRLEGVLPLHVSLGFTPCAAFYANPMPDVVYMERWLRPRHTAAGTAAGASPSSDVAATAVVVAAAAADTMSSGSGGSR